MKNSKYCHITACCWDFRHELLGIILLIIATFLTIVTGNGFGIIAIFLVGGVLCCYRHLCCCHAHHGDIHCHSVDEGAAVMSLEKNDKPKVKKSTGKTKK